jgi:O-antigen ligase
MIFTAVLFFRPQDQVPALAVLHLADLSALGALASLIFGRLSRGLSITRVTPELIGVVLIGVLMVAGAPFSVWPGGALSTFTDIYSKVILIFLLMVNTLTSRKRIEQFIWLLVIASGYIAFRAVLDYARGINLIENGRVQGSVGGMFKNPNDLALNMVAVMPLAGVMVFRTRSAVARAGAVLAAALMVGAIVASQSRAGTVGLVVMTLAMGFYLVRRKPAAAGVCVMALFLAMPLLPASYWSRLSSITDETQDQTGSREARRTLLRESFAAFLEHPITGVGAGQFKNYNPEGREQPWRESHNIVLQVAAELGFFGVAALLFLLARGGLAGVRTQRLLRRARGVVPRGRRSRGAPRRLQSTPGMDAQELEWFEGHAAAMSAALLGWFFCALFASVAYNWTFYYLLALATVPTAILDARLESSRRAKAVPEPLGGLREARA